MPFPVTVKSRRFTNADALTTFLRTVTIEHPGQIYPSDALDKDRQNPEVRQALAVAAEELVSDASSTQEQIILGAHLTHFSHLPGIVAVLDRLEAAIQQEETLDSDTLRQLRRALQGHQVATDKVVSKRVLDVFLHFSDVDNLVAFLANGDPHHYAPVIYDDLLDSDYPGKDNMIYCLALAITRSSPDFILPKAKETGEKVPESAHTYLEAVQRGDASWYIANEEELRKALDV